MTGWDFFYFVLKLSESCPYARDYSRRPMDERINEMMMNDPEMMSDDDWQRYANRMNG